MSCHVIPSKMPVIEVAEVIRHCISERALFTQDEATPTNKVNQTVQYAEIYRDGCRQRA